MLNCAAEFLGHLRGLGFLLARREARKLREIVRQ
jgi:hypothetical protein